MTLLLAAVGATVTALLELTIGPYLRVGNAEPHLVLVVGIVVTLALDLEAGLVWAFVGGLVLDVLAQRPLGSTAFALLLCLGGGRAARSGRSPVCDRSFPIPAAVRPEPALLDDRSSSPSTPCGRRSRLPIRSAGCCPAPSTTWSLAALIGPLAISIHDRRAEVERVDW